MRTFSLSVFENSVLPGFFSTRNLKKVLSFYTGILSYLRALQKTFVVLHRGFVVQKKSIVLQNKVFTYGIVKTRF